MPVDTAIVIGSARSHAATSSTPLLSSHPIRSNFDKIRLLRVESGARRLQGVDAHVVHCEGLEFEVDISGLATEYSAHGEIEHQEELVIDVICYISPF